MFEIFRIIVCITLGVIIGGVGGAYIGRKICKWLGL